MQRRSLLLLPLLAACASVDVEQVTTVVGVVETVDRQTREVLLRGQGGAQTGMLLTVIAGRGVQRFDEVRPGSRVTVSYYQALAAQVARPLESSPEPFAGVGFARNADRPGGEVTRVRAGRVVVTAVDAASGTVSFVGPGNVVRTVSPKNSEVRAFVRQLRVGDRVDVLYEEALAISMEPMAPAT